MAESWSTSMLLTGERWRGGVGSAIVAAVVLPEDAAGWARARWFCETARRRFDISLRRGKRRRWLWDRYKRLEVLAQRRSVVHKRWRSWNEGWPTAECNSGQDNYWALNSIMTWGDCKRWNLFRRRWWRWKGEGDDLLKFRGVSAWRLTFGAEGRYVLTRDDLGYVIGSGS